MIAGLIVLAAAALIFLPGLVQRLRKPAPAAAPEPETDWAAAEAWWASQGKSQLR